MLPVIIRNLNQYFGKGTLCKQVLFNINLEIRSGEIIILTGQSDPYPSLNKVCEYYGLESKLDIVAEEYWKNKIDTPDIPEEILKEYLAQDIKLTEQVYLKQLEQIETVPHLKRLISLHNQDLLVLQEMEFNGLLYDTKQSINEGEKLATYIDKIDESLYQHHTCPQFNPNSTDHLSAFLYGGDISLKRRVVIGTFKTGSRVGQPKERWEDYTVSFPRLVNPLKGSELMKEGLYSTDENTLKSLRGSKQAKEIIPLEEKFFIFGYQYHHFVEKNISNSEFSNRKFGILCRISNV
jgi:hypothetical protein